MSPKYLVLLLLIFCLALTAVGCSPTDSAPKPNQLLVVATTTIVGDVVSQVGGGHIAVQVLLPAGTDPHSFEPTPKDIAAVTKADLVFANGLGLESFLESLISNAGNPLEMIIVSEGIPPLSTPGESSHAGENSASRPDQQDPHVWMDPNLVKVWVVNIERALSIYDPANASDYQANAQNYLEQLTQLDTWIHSQVAQVPQQNRTIISDHQVFGYFAHTYGFTQVGAVIPGYSTMAEPSAQELAVLEDTIRQLNVKAIFVGDTVNPNLAQRVADDTQTKLVTVLTASLTPPGGPASSYLDYMRDNVSTIVSALK